MHSIAFVCIVMPGPDQASLYMSHKAECGDTDADRRRENLPQSLEAGMKGGSRGEDVVDKDYVAYASAIREYGDCVLSYGKGIRYVLRLSLHVQLSLCPGTSVAHEYVRADGDSHASGSGAGYDFGLIISSLPLSQPVKRHRNDHINIRKRLRIRQTSSKHMPEMLSYGQVAVIFDLIRNPFVSAVLLI